MAQLRSRNEAVSGEAYEPDLDIRSRGHVGHELTGPIAAAIGWIATTPPWRAVTGIPFLVLKPVAVVLAARC